MRHQSGQAGEKAAEFYFKKNGWHMVRTQPPITILGLVTKPMVATLRRFIPRLAYFGHMVIARMGSGGVPDYTGYVMVGNRPTYIAVEVKECNKDTMPASRLSVRQREFLSKLPVGAAFVGILWGDGTFDVYPFIGRGSYKKER